MQSTTAATTTSQVPLRVAIAFLLLLVGFLPIRTQASNGEHRLQKDDGLQHSLNHAGQIEDQSRLGSMSTSSTYSIMLPMPSSNQPHSNRISNEGRLQSLQMIPSESNDDGENEKEVVGKGSDTGDSLQTYRQELHLAGSNKGQEQLQKIDALHHELFELSFSEEGATITYDEPVLIHLYETIGALSGNAMEVIRQACNDFLLAEFNSYYPKQYQLADVSTMVTFLRDVKRNPVRRQRTTTITTFRNNPEQEHHHHERPRRRRRLSSSRSTNHQREVVQRYFHHQLTQHLQHRNLQENTVVGSEVKVDVEVTFENDPAPSTKQQETAMDVVWKDLTHLLTNITHYAALYDFYSELDLVNQVVLASEVGKEDSTKKTTTNETTSAISQVVQDIRTRLDRDDRSLRALYPSILAGVAVFILTACCIAMRRKQQQAAASQKVHHDYDDDDDDQTGSDVVGSDYDDVADGSESPLYQYDPNRQVESIYMQDGQTTVHVPNVTSRTATRGDTVVSGGRNGVTLLRASTGTTSFRDGSSGEGAILSRSNQYNPKYSLPANQMVLSSASSHGSSEYYPYEYDEADDSGYDVDNETDDTSRIMELGSSSSEYQDGRNDNTDYSSSSQERPAARYRKVLWPQRKNGTKNRRNQDDGPIPYRTIVEEGNEEEDEEDEESNKLQEENQLCCGDNAICG